MQQQQQQNGSNNNNITTNTNNNNNPQQSTNNGQQIIYHPNCFFYPTQQQQQQQLPTATNDQYTYTAVTAESAAAASRHLAANPNAYTNQNQRYEPYMYCKYLLKNHKKTKQTIFYLFFKANQVGATAFYDSNTMNQIAAQQQQQVQQVQQNYGNNPTTTTTNQSIAPPGAIHIQQQQQNTIFTKNRNYIPLYCGLCRSYDCTCQYTNYQSNAAAAPQISTTTTTSTSTTTTSSTNKISPTPTTTTTTTTAYLPSPSTTPTIQQQQQPLMAQAYPQQQHYNNQTSNSGPTPSTTVNILQNYKIPYNQQHSHEQQQQQQQQGYQFNIASAAAPNLYAAANYQAYFQAINSNQRQPLPQQPQHIQHPSATGAPNTLYYTNNQLIQQPNGTYQLILPAGSYAAPQANDGQQQQIQIQTIPHGAYIQQPHHLIQQQNYHVHAAYAAKPMTQAASPSNNEDGRDIDVGNENVEGIEKTNDMNENIKNFFMNANQQIQQQQQQPGEASSLTRRSYSDNQIIDTRYPLNQIDNAIIVQSSHIPPLPQAILQQQQAQKDVVIKQHVDNRQQQQQQPQQLQTQFQSNYLQNALNQRKEFYDLQQNAQSHPTFFLTNTGNYMMPSAPLKINTLNKTNK
jgi:hypothetical protein